MQESSPNWIPIDSGWIERAAYVPHEGGKGYLLVHPQRGRVFAKGEALPWSIGLLKAGAGNGHSSGKMFNRVFRGLPTLPAAVVEPLLKELGL